MPESGALLTDGDAGDGEWATTVRLTRGVTIAYQYRVGVAGDGSWAGVELEGDNRGLRVDDVDRGGRVIVGEVFGGRGGESFDQ